MRSNRHIVFAAAVVALASPTVSGAATPRPVIPSVDQYIEAIPTSAGPQSAARGGERVRPLTLAAQRQVEAEAGSDAEALTEVATSSRYGAPVESSDDRTEAPPRSAAPPSHKPAETEEENERSALEQMPAQAVEGVESRLVGLVAFMLVTLIAALGYAWRRSSKEPR
jgi:hypothetical protein